VYRRHRSRRGGEIQLTDAMNLLAQRQPVYALAWQARRYDIGNRVEYAKCFIDFALRRPETAAAVREHLRAILEEASPIAQPPHGHPPRFVLSASKSDASIFFV